MSNGHFAAVFGLGRATPDREDVLHRRLVKALSLVNESPVVASTLSPSMTYLGSGDVELARPSAVTGPDLKLASVVDPTGHVRTDDIGLSRCCWGQRGRFVIVSSSALVVAAGTKATVDLGEVAVLSLVGFLLDNATLYEGVYRLGAATGLNLRGAEPTVELLESSETASIGGARAGAEVMRRIVSALISDYPQALLELSGGLDSRAVLAAIPQDARGELRAFTIGSSNHSDVRVARQLADVAGVEWNAIDAGAIAMLTPADLQSAARRAARRRDHVANVLSAMTLDHVEKEIPPGPRFTGANGEFARGFYYAGFPSDGPVDAKRVRRLVDWRLTTNEGSAARVLRAEVINDARQRVTQRVASLLGHERRWRAATDEFYLYTRMASWAGPGYSARDTASPALAPFFHPSFLEWARSLPARRRSRELAFARMVSALDPRLASVPLDRGIAVSTLAAGGPTGLARDLGTTFVKAVRKGSQRIRSRGKPPPVGGGLAPALQAGWSTRQTRLLHDSELFRPEFLDALDEGRPVDPAALSLAFNVADLSEIRTSVDTGGERTTHRLE